MSELSTGTKFSKATLQEYANLQKLLYDAIDDVLIRYLEGNWYVFCPSVQQTILTTLVLCHHLQHAPQSMEARNPENQQTYCGFSVSNYFVFHKPDDPKSRARIDSYEVREMLATQMGLLSRFFD